MKTKGKGISMLIFTISVILIALTSYIGVYGLEVGGYQIKSFKNVIKQGLDLKGGISIVSEITDKDVDKDKISRTLLLLQSRINPNGVSEISVAQEGKNRIRIDIPGKYDVKEIEDSVMKPGNLKFTGPDNNVVLTGDDVEEAKAVLTQEGNPQVALKLSTEGAKKFAEATNKFVGQAITISVDEKEISSPTVQSVITNGNAVIDHMSSFEEAKNLANMISSGALPVTLKTVSTKVVGPTLGATALPNCVKAGAAAIGIVLLFMIIYYRIPGIMADIALVLFTLLVLLAYVALDVTLSLAGIAGLLLTVGMAVDANILIFERMKEELKSGKSIKSAIDAGFHRALASILDSQITTIIAGIVLYWIGTGTVKGFALTLIIGAVISIFTAITVTRFLIKHAANMGWFNKKWTIGTFWVVGIKDGQTKMLKIIEKTKVWFAISLIVILIGAGFTATKGLELGIDFAGGSIIELKVPDKFTNEDRLEAEKIIKKHIPDATTNLAQTQAETGKSMKTIEIKTIGKSETVNAGKVTTMVKDLQDTFKDKDGKDIDVASQDEIGSAVGKETLLKSFGALAVATVAMLIYIIVRFEVKFATAAILSLVHDVLVTLAFYAVFRKQLDLGFVAAILTVYGFSVDDTIVVFDRIRENQRLMGKASVTELANASLTQTMARSINTVLTVLITLVAVYIFVPSIRSFSQPLLVGIASGCYSSIFIATPFWVVFKKMAAKRKAVPVRK